MVPKDKTSSPIDSLYPPTPRYADRKIPRPPRRRRTPPKPRQRPWLPHTAAAAARSIVRKSNDLIQNAMSTLTLSQQKLMLHILR